MVGVVDASSGGKNGLSTPRNGGKKSQVSTAKFRRGRILQASLTNSYRQRRVPGLLLRGNLKHPDLGSTALKHLSLPLHGSRTRRSESATLRSEYATLESCSPLLRLRDGISLAFGMAFHLGYGHPIVSG